MIQICWVGLKWVDYDNNNIIIIMVVFLFFLFVCLEVGWAGEILGRVCCYGTRYWGFSLIITIAHFCYAYYTSTTNERV